MPKKLEKKHKSLLPALERVTPEVVTIRERTQSKEPAVDTWKSEKEVITDVVQASLKKINEQTFVVKHDPATGEPKVVLGLHESTGGGELKDDDKGGLVKAPRTFSFHPLAKTVEFKKLMKELEKY